MALPFFLRHEIPALHFGRAEFAVAGLLPIRHFAGLEAEVDRFCRRLDALGLQFKPDDVYAAERDRKKRRRMLAMSAQLAEADLRFVKAVVLMPLGLERITKVSLGQRRRGLLNLFGNLEAVVLFDVAGFFPDRDLAADGLFLVVVIPLPFRGLFVGGLGLGQ